MMIPGVPWQSWGSAIAGHGIKMPSPTSGKVRNHEESRNPKSGQCTYPNQDVSCPSKHLESLILYCHRSTGKLRDLGCTRWVRWFACQSGQTHSLRTWSHGPVEMTWVFTAINWCIFPVRYVHLKTNRLFSTDPTAGPKPAAWVLWCSKAQWRPSPRWHLREIPSVNFP